MEPEESEQSIKLRNTRERELARKAKGRLADTFEAAVVGVSFVPSFPGNLYELERLGFMAEASGERLAAVIIRNPANPHDANACEVHVPALGDMAMVGHIPAALAARLAPELDEGVRWQAEVSFIRINHDHPEHPGLTISLARRNRQEQ